MTKINNNLKEKEKENLDLSGLNLTLKGEKDVANLKMKLDNHVKFLQIIFYDNEKCLDYINELEKSI